MRLLIFLVIVVVVVALSGFSSAGFSDFENMVCILLSGVGYMIAIVAYILVDISDNIKNLRYNK